MLGLHKLESIWLILNYLNRVYKKYNLPITPLIFWNLSSMIQFHWICKVIEHKHMVSIQVVIEIKQKRYFNIIDFNKKI